MAAADAREEAADAAAGVNGIGDDDIDVGNDYNFGNGGNSSNGGGGGGKKQKRRKKELPSYPANAVSVCARARLSSFVFALAGCL